MSRLYDVLPLVAQNAACTWGGFRRARTRYTSRFDQALREWERTAHGPLDALHAIQRRRLDVLVRRAREHVPYYRDLAPPSELPDPREAVAETLGRIPPLEKRAYRDHCLKLISQDFRRSSLRRGQTSGTTGTALPLWCTKENLAEEYATVWRFRRAFGVDVMDPNLWFGGQIVVPFRQTDPPYWRRNLYSHQTLFSLYHMKRENLSHYVRAVHDTPARYVQGYPSSLHLVALALLEENRPLPPGRIQGVFTSSESLLAFQREGIEKAFGAPVRDRYGTSEFAVSMTACSENGLHVDMEFCIVEVEPEEETDEYVRGPLLVTGLGTHATPFLRYRIGDVGTRSKKPCPCGRPGDVFLDLDGRTEDFVMTPDGRLVGRLDHIFKGQPGVAEAQILQETKDAIIVLVVPRVGYSDATDRQLRRAIEARLGRELHVDIETIDSIPREPNGKFRAVKSRIGNLRP